MRIIDLSLPIHEAHWLFPVTLERQSSFEQGALFQASSLMMSLHAFTHVDAPRHYVPSGPTVADLPLAAWWGEAAVVDVSAVGPRQPVTAGLLEQVGIGVREGDIVLLRSSWDQRCSFATREYFIESPYLSEDGAGWLLKRGVRALGLDFITDEVLKDVLTNPGGTRRGEQFVSHHVLLRQGVLLIENLCNLHQLRRERVLLLALPLPLEGADGSPCRAVALELDQ